jgi:hypothetical protein
VLQAAGRMKCHASSGGGTQQCRQRIGMRWQQFRQVPGQGADPRGLVRIDRSNNKCRFCIVAQPDAFITMASRLLDVAPGIDDAARSLSRPGPSGDDGWRHSSRPHAPPPVNVSIEYARSQR